MIIALALSLACRLAANCLLGTVYRRLKDFLAVTTTELFGQRPHSSRLHLFHQKPMRQAQLCLQNQSGKAPRYLLSWDGLYRGQAHYQDISKQQAEECERRINNYRALQHKLDQIAEDALINAPWNQSP